MEGQHWIISYCSVDRSEFYKYCLSEHHFTPEVLSTQFTILQLIELFTEKSIEAGILNNIRNHNDNIFKDLLRKKGILKNE
jgi:hypothetical protein